MGTPQAREPIVTAKLKYSPAGSGLTEFGIVSNKLLTLPLLCGQHAAEWSSPTPGLLGTVPVWSLSARSCWRQHRATPKQRRPWSSLLLFQWVNPNQDFDGSCPSTLYQHSLHVASGVVSGKYRWWCGPSLSPYLACRAMSLQWTSPGLWMVWSSGLKPMNRTLWISGWRYSHVYIRPALEGHLLWTALALEA